jgi:hypothetical protein
MTRPQSPSKRSTTGSRRSTPGRSLPGGNRNWSKPSAPFAFTGAQLNLPHHFHRPILPPSQSARPGQPHIPPRTLPRPRRIRRPKQPFHLHQSRCRSRAKGSLSRLRRPRRWILWPRKTSCLRQPQIVNPPTPSRRAARPPSRLRPPRLPPRPPKNTRDPGRHRRLCRPTLRSRVTVLPGQLRLPVFPRTVAASLRTSRPKRSRRLRRPLTAAPRRTPRPELPQILRPPTPSRLATEPLSRLLRPRPGPPAFPRTSNLRLFPRTAVVASRRLPTNLPRRLRRPTPGPRTREPLRRLRPLPRPTPRPGATAPPGLSHRFPPTLTAPAPSRGKIGPTTSCSLTASG